MKKSKLPKFLGYSIRIGNQCKVFKSLDEIYEFSRIFGFVPDEVIGLTSAVGGFVFQFIKAKNKGLGWKLKF